MSSTATRQTAEERREAVLEAAASEFSRKGLHGASTEAIAKTAGISQPYLFRLFGTKKELYLAATRLKMEEIYQAFERASRGKTGEEALLAMGDAYQQLIEDRERLQLMLQCMAAAADDPEIREGMRRVWRDLVELVERVGGGTQAEVSAFFAKGMLLNVLNAMRLFDEPAPWGDRLIAGCREDA
jgi:AcrR family transcriptional regulator